MRRFLHAGMLQVGTLALALSAVAGPASADDRSVALASVAPKLGFSYTWLASEAAVALSRPGLYVLLRAGNPLYDVNDSIESTTQAPVFRDNDIYICHALVSHLNALALKYAPRHTRLAIAASAREADPPPIRGALSVTVVPTNVSSAIVVSGNGPINVPLTITLRADISREMPRVLLSRTEVTTDAAGRFSLQLNTAPLHMQKSLILVSAQSLPGISEAHASFVLGDPSPDIVHPVDELPTDFRPHR